MKIFCLALTTAYFTIAGEATEYAHCTEYRDILQKHQMLLGDYQTCVTQNGEQHAEIRVYQNLITGGLQSQIIALKQEQSDKNIALKTELTEEKLIKGNEISNLKNDMKRNTETIDTVKANQDAVVRQQSGLRSTQSEHATKFDELDDKIKRVCVDQFNELFDQKMQSMATKKDIEELQSKIDDVTISQPVPEVAYFTATRASTFATRSQPIPFTNIVNEKNSGFDGSTGVMTTKIKGLYHFSASIMPGSGHNMEIDLMHNDNRVHRGYETVSGYNMVSLTATLPLEIGDRVYVRNVNGAQIHGNSNHFGAFTGFKVSNI